MAASAPDAPVAGRTAAIGVLDRLQRIGAGVEATPCNGHGVIVMDRASDAVALIASERTHSRQLAILGPWCPWRSTAVTDLDLLGTQVAVRASSNTLRSVVRGLASTLGNQDEVEELLANLPVMSPFERRRSRSGRRQVRIAGPSELMQPLALRAGLFGLPTPTQTGPGQATVIVDSADQLADLLPPRWTPILPAALIDEVVRTSPAHAAGMAGEAILRSDRLVRARLAALAWDRGAPAENALIPGADLFDPERLRGEAGATLRSRLRQALGGNLACPWWNDSMMVVSAHAGDMDRLTMVIESAFAAVPTFAGEDADATLIIDADLVTGTVREQVEHGMRLGRKHGLSVIVVGEHANAQRCTELATFGDFRLVIRGHSGSLTAGSAAPIPFPPPAPESLIPGLALLQG